MSTVHVLNRVGEHEFRVVIHFAVPGGNNSAGFTWKAVGKELGLLGSSRLSEGTGPGQISTAELAQVVAGDVVEFETTIKAETGGTSAAQLGAALDAGATLAISTYQARLSRELKWFGTVRA